MPQRKNENKIKSNAINISKVERECTQEECLKRCDSMPLTEILFNRIPLFYYN